jgi:RHS repeat-associated protein
MGARLPFSRRPVGWQRVAPVIRMGEKAVQPLGVVILVLAGTFASAMPARAQTLPLACTGFSDDPLNSGVTVQAQHVTELRACVDALRVQVGLTAVTWTDLTLQAGETWIRAVHVIELRTALNAVYTAQGDTPPAYTDPTLTPQATLVRSAHITEIRTAILVVAGVCAPETCGNNGPIDEAIEYYHLDALGSVRIVTDEVGEVVRRHDYFPFGEGVSAIDGYVQRYADQEGDPESGLSYFGARYYRAWTGRFTTVDPVFAGVSNPQQWNRYAYALNSPMVFVDPDGLEAELRFWTSVDVYAQAPPVDPTPWFDWGLLAFIFGGYFDGGDTGTDAPNRRGGGGHLPAPGEQPTPETPAPSPEPPSPPPGATPPPESGTTPPAPAAPNPKSPTDAESPDHGIANPVGARNDSTSWYKNPCVASALGAGALSVSIDAIGLIPAAGGVARAIGNGAGYRGVVADQQGYKFVNAVGRSTSTVQALNGAFHTTPTGLISTGLAVAGFIPGLGQLTSGASIVVDVFRTGSAIGQCR